MKLRCRILVDWSDMYGLDICDVTLWFVTVLDFINNEITREQSQVLFEHTIHNGYIIRVIITLCMS